MQLLNHPEYKEYIEKIKTFEKNRIYCKHDIYHMLDVARIAYIMALENKYQITKEVIYATALLHDIGRWKQYLYNTDHAEESAKLSQNILIEIGFKNDDVEAITLAISEHREKKRERSQLSHILYESDKASRICDICKAMDTCKRVIAGQAYEFDY